MSNTPNILFIIGNGFDLGLNMKTSYNDVYESYLESPSKSVVIERFKEELRNRKPYDKWSDFEMGMAEYATTLSSENELIECVRDFKQHMVNHLKEENNKIISAISSYSYPNHILSEYIRSVDDFYGGLTPNAASKIETQIQTNGTGKCFVTFNYTYVLDAIQIMYGKKYGLSLPPPVHIHGDINNDVVLGVDNECQLDGVSFPLTNRSKRAFIKTVFNNQYDSTRIEKVRKSIFDSTVICTYGFSMGESDKTWVNMLKEWLEQDKNHHLVAYQYDEKQYNKYNFDEIMDVEESKKKELMVRMGINESDILMDQVHIPISYDIFNFKFVSTLTEEEDYVSLGG